MFAPIVFFAFNRPYHTKLSLTALSINKEAKDSDLILFIDGPKFNGDLQAINNVETVVNSFKKSFKSITVNKNSKNLGSAYNQISGITKVFEIYEKAIVIEDDICVSNYFLKYMNDALLKYVNDKKVWHINGFNFPINIKNDSCYFSRVMFCWGWATWKNRWMKHIDDPLSHDPFYLKNLFSRKMLRELDLDTNVKFFSSQITMNYKSKNTWAIFWYAFIFLNKGLCLTPYFSLTKNIGHDGSGINCRENKKVQNALINSKPINNFPDYQSENHITLKKMGKYLKTNYNIRARIFRYLRHIINKK